MSQSFSVDSFNMYILYISRVISLLYKRLPYVALNTYSLVQ